MTVCVLRKRYECAKNQQPRERERERERKGSAKSHLVTWNIQVPALLGALLSPWQWAGHDSHHVHNRIDLSANPPIQSELQKKKTKKKTKPHTKPKKQKTEISQHSSTTVTIHSSCADLKTSFFFKKLGWGQKKNKKTKEKEKEIANDSSTECSSAKRVRVGYFSRCCCCCCCCCCGCCCCCCCRSVLVLEMGRSRPASRA